MSNRATITLSGIGASAGVAIGEVFLLERHRVAIPRRITIRGDIEAEVARFDRALQRSDEQLLAMKEEVEAREGPEQALIIEAHRLMLKDPAFNDEVRGLIRSLRVNAEWAVRRCVRKLRGAFRRMGDEYFRERRHDLSYVSDRLVRNLLGEEDRITPERIPPGAILVARDLSPAEAALLLRHDRIGGLVMDRGTRTSHTAIVARARGVPAVVGVGRIMSQVAPGDELAIDGQQGMIVLRPDAAGMARFEEARARQQAKEALLSREGSLPSITRDGVEIALMANVEFLPDVSILERSGARGVGLFRTEFLYLGQERLPTEEEHFLAYRELLMRTRGAPVTIRTLDLGADKLPGWRQRKGEVNPAMGVRALRLLRRRPELLDVQLRALLRAAAHGPIRILFPMISCVSELRFAKEAVERARAALRERGEPGDAEVQLGVMIEVPSAVHVVDRLAREVDFFSIGTNDLIQYTLAIDRQNHEVADLYRPGHLAILRMIRAVVEAARAREIPVAVCGEMAGDPRYALLLLGLGVDELSMTASAIPLVRRVIRDATAAEGRELLEAALDLDTSEEIEALIDARMKDRLAALLPGAA